MSSEKADPPPPFEGFILAPCGICETGWLRSTPCGGLFKCGVCGALLVGGVRKKPVSIEAERERWRKLLAEEDAVKGSSPPSDGVDPSEPPRASPSYAHCVGHESAAVRGRFFSAPMTLPPGFRLIISAEGFTIEEASK